MRRRRRDAARRVEGARGRERGEGGAEPWQQAEVRLVRFLCAFRDGLREGLQRWRRGAEDAPEGRAVGRGNVDYRDDGRDAGGHCVVGKDYISTRARHVVETRQGLVTPQRNHSPSLATTQPNA